MTWPCQDINELTHTPTTHNNILLYMTNSSARVLVAADVSRRHIQRRKNAPTAVGGYAQSAYRAIP